jgi:hypothetical protein
MANVPDYGFRRITGNERGEKASWPSPFQDKERI